MSIFRRPDYQSDATQFINQLKSSRPELDQQQQAGGAAANSQFFDTFVRVTQMGFQF